MPAEGLEPPTNGLQSSDRVFQGLMIQPLAALASPVPSPATAQLRHSQSEHGTFPAQGFVRRVQFDASPVFSCYYISEKSRSGMERNIWLSIPRLSRRMAWMIC